MYRILFSLLLILACSGCGNKQSNRNKPSNQNEQKEQKESAVVVTNAMWQSDVIAPIKEALERVALASVKISGDTEGEWAASNVVMLSDSLDKVDSLSFNLYDAMYDLYTVQTYIAYGLAYFPSLLSMYSDCELAHRGVGIINTWNKLLEEKPQEKQLDWLSYVGLYSLFNYTSYFAAYNTMTGEQCFNVDAHHEMISEMNSYMEGIHTLCPVDTVGYQHFCVLEASAFFMTYCPIIPCMYPREKYEKNMQEDIIAIAGWFDEKAAEIRNAVYKGIAPKAMSDEKFYQFMRKVTKCKVQLLDFLIVAINEVELEEAEK